MSNEIEIWKDIPGLEGRYQAGSLGNIKSLMRVTPIGANKKVIHEKIRTPCIHPKTGYAYISIIVSKIYKQFLVHRLIGLSFLPNPENKKTINHKNGIKHDNRVENLEWATPSENSRHRYDVLLIRSINNKGSKKVAQYKDGVLIKVWPSGRELTRAGFNIRNIKTAISKNYNCAGFKWGDVA